MSQTESAFDALGAGIASAKNEPHVSQRAQVVLQTAVPMMEKFVGLLSNMYSQENPNGIINLGVAENTLMHKELTEFYHSNFKLTDIDFSYGDSLVGSKRLFKGLCALFTKYFNPITEVLPEHIITGVGAGAVVDQTIQVLCDEGEAVLIATPYYNGFDMDIAVRSKGYLVGVDTGDVDPSSPETLAAFETKIVELKAQGVTPRVVILCNPNNPLGFHYSRETLLAYCRFCEKHNLHLVSDEIYALSQFKNDTLQNPTPFISMLAIDAKKEAGCNPGRVHVIYGMSKDFGSNGFRIGVFVTQHNTEVYRSFLGTAILMKVSSPSDVLWSALLNDPEKLEGFVNGNQAKLTETFVYCRNFFQKHKIPMLQPQAAHFIFIDLNGFMRHEDDEGKKLATPLERDTDLWETFLKSGLYVAPGYAYHYTKPGWFRFTFCIRRDVLDVGLDRFARVLESRRKLISNL